MQHRPRFGKVAQTDVLPPRLAFSLYPSPVFSGLGDFFQSTSQGGNKSHLGRRSGLCRPAFAKRPHLHTVFRRALPFPFTPVRFFRVSGTFSQKSTRVGCGAAPHIYILLHTGARGGALCVLFCKNSAQTDIPSPHFTFFLYPFSVFSGLGYFFPKKYPSGVWGSAPHIHSPSCRGARRSLAYNLTYY